MVGERTIEGWLLRLRPQGAGRYLTGAFLLFWLCGWAVGEVLALGALVLGALAILTGRSIGPVHQPVELLPALMMGTFLAVWLAMWTFGGISALSELFRQLWGEDRITIASGRLTVTHVRGPFRSTRVFDRDVIRRVSLVGRDDRLTVDTTGRSGVGRALFGRHVELSALGTRAERVEALREMRSELGIVEEQAVGSALPGAWEEVITPEGERALVSNVSTRRAQARTASIVTLVFAGLTLLAVRESIQRWEVAIAAVLLLAITAALAAGALWLARGRWEWRIGSGRLTLRKRYGASVSDVFEGRRLVFDSTSDSDGDVWYELVALSDAAEPARPAAIQWRSSASKDRRQIARVMNDGASVRDLAVWLANQTGLALDDRTTPEARAMQFADLHAALESSGRFGRWMAGLIDRVGEGGRKAG